MKRTIMFVLMTLLLVSTGNAVMAYQEAPMLADLVAEGELPPVSERLPKNPLVVEPVHEIGTYGGTLRTATTSIADRGCDIWLMQFSVGLVYPLGQQDMELVPHFAEALTPSDDMRVWTFHIREGVRWSDGHPFTADDVLFWYEDILLNTDLTPSVGLNWRSGGEIVEVAKVDDFTVEFRFAQPRPYFAEFMVIDGPAWGLFQPKHYLSQFHPNYRDGNELAEAVEAANFQHWYELFWAMNQSWAQVSLRPERPTLTPYVLKSITTDRRVLERNPYYWKVDSAGNQLPYIDRIETYYAGDIEVLQGQIMGGQIDVAVSIHAVSIDNYPMYRQFEEEGNFNTYLWQNALGSELVYNVNLNHSDPVVRDIFQDARFRQALSLGINREEMLEVFFFGHGIPRQWTVLDVSQYFEPEFATAYADFDPEAAEQLLDELGLSEKDAEGYRLRPDGKRLMFTVATNTDIRTKNAELVTQYWNELGLDARVEQMSTELMSQRIPANAIDVIVWGGDKASDILFPFNAAYTVPRTPGLGTILAPEWGPWLDSGGELGTEPTQEIQNVRQWWEQMMVEPDADRRIELGKRILASQAENLWTIGTVGETPHPMIVNKDLRNFPEVGLWAWDLGFGTPYDMETLYFDR